MIEPLASDKLPGLTATTGATQSLVEMMSLPAAAFSVEKAGSV
jgi:hypothetical protein